MSLAPTVDSYSLSESYFWVVDRNVAGDGSTSLPNEVGRWNGTIWESVGGTGFTAVDGNPRTRGVHAVSDTEVYIVGNFNQIGGVSADNVAMWNGTTFVALGTPPFTFANSNATCQILTYDSFNSRLYVASTNTSRATHQEIAYWNGTSWSPDFYVGHIDSGDITSLETDGTGKIYVGGDYLEFSGSLWHNYHIYNGNTDSWEFTTGTNVPEGPNKVVSSAYSSTDNAFYVITIQDDILKYDIAADTYTALPSSGPASAQLRDIAIGPNNEIYVYQVNSNFEEQVVRLDGGSWTPLFTNVETSGGYTMVVDSNNNIYLRPQVVEDYYIYSVGDDSWEADTDNFSSFSFGGAIESGSAPAEGGAGGDPHVKPVYGARYDLPHTEDTFMLLANNRVPVSSGDYVSIKGKCWKLPVDRYSDRILRLRDNGYEKRADELSKHLENATYFKYIEFVVGNNMLIIDMENLEPRQFTSLQDVDNCCLSPVSMREVSKMSGRIKLTKIKRTSRGLFGKSQGTETTIERMVYLYTRYGILRVRLAKDRNNLIYRNSVEVKIDNNRNMYYGALIRKSEATKTEFNKLSYSKPVEVSPDTMFSSYITV